MLEDFWNYIRRIQSRAFWVGLVFFVFASASSIFLSYKLEDSKTGQSLALLLLLVGFLSFYIQDRVEVTNLVSANADAMKSLSLSRDIKVIDNKEAIRYLDYRIPSATLILNTNFYDITTVSGDILEDVTNRLAKWLNNYDISWEEVTLNENRPDMVRKKLDQNRKNNYITYTLKIDQVRIPEFVVFQSNNESFVMFGFANSWRGAYSDYIFLSHSRELVEYFKTFFRDVVAGNAERA